MENTTSDVYDKGKVTRQVLLYLFEVSELRVN